MFTKQWLKDVAERAGATAAQVFLTLFLVTDLSTAETALTAALAAGLAVLKGAIATRIGDRDTASLLGGEHGTSDAGISPEKDA